MFDNVISVSKIIEFENNIFQRVLCFELEKSLWNSIFFHIYTPWYSEIIYKAVLNSQFSNFENFLKNTIDISLGIFGKIDQKQEAKIVRYIMKHPNINWVCELFCPASLIQLGNKLIEWAKWKKYQNCKIINGWSCKHFLLLCKRSVGQKNSNQSLHSFEIQTTKTESIFFCEPIPFNLETWFFLPHPSVWWTFPTGDRRENGWDGEQKWQRERKYIEQHKN